MKKFLLLLLLPATVFTSCKKDNTAFVVKDPNSLEDATVVTSGKLSFSDERNDEGLVKIYQRKDKVYVLGLEQMNYQTVFSDTNIYLSATPGLTTSSIKVFSAKKLHGNVYQPMTSGINIPAFKYLIIQGDADADPVATALLQ